MARVAPLLMLPLLVVACGPEAETEECAALPRLCEVFTFEQVGDELVLYRSYASDEPASTDDVHCVLEAIRDVVPSSVSFAESVELGDAIGLRQRRLLVYADGTLEIDDSTTPNWPDPASPQPRDGHFTARDDQFLADCLATNDTRELLDCMWSLEAEPLPESDCKPRAGGPARPGGGSRGE